MELRLHIDQLYREIADYDGYFGDPIEIGPYNPFDTGRKMSPNDPEREGVGVAILCHLMTATDNGGGTSMLWPAASLGKRSSFAARICSKTYQPSIEPSPRFSSQRMDPWNP